LTILALLITLDALDGVLQAEDRAASTTPKKKGPRK